MWPFRTFERYTDRSRKLMYLANLFAHLSNNADISPGHMLLALIDETLETGVGKSMLLLLVDIPALRGRFHPVPADRPAAVMQKLPLSAASKTLIKNAIAEARALKDNYVGTEHLLLSMSRTNGIGEILAEFGATHATLLAGLHVIRAAVAKSENKWPESIRQLNLALCAHADSLVWNEIAWVYATGPEVLDPRKAIDFATRACEAGQYKNAQHLGTLAAACATSGDFPRAIEWQDKALAIQPDLPNGAENLARYRAGKKPTDS